MASIVTIKTFRGDRMTLTLKADRINETLYLETPAGSRVAVFDEDERDDAESFALEWVNRPTCATGSACGRCAFCMVGQSGR